jgi:hypothetical protein
VKNLPPRVNREMEKYHQSPGEAYLLREGDKVDGMWALGGEHPNLLIFRFGIFIDGITTFTISL